MWRLRPPALLACVTQRTVQVCCLSTWCLCISHRNAVRESRDLVVDPDVRVHYQCGDAACCVHTQAQHSSPCMMTGRKQFCARIVLGHYRVRAVFGRARVRHIRLVLLQKYPESGGPGREANAAHPQRARGPGDARAAAIRGARARGLPQPLGILHLPPQQCALPAVQRRRPRRVWRPTQ